MINDTGAPNAWDNGTVIDRHDLAEDLAVFRVKPDGDLFSFRAGQYTVIGLPASVPRFETSDPDDDETLPGANSFAVPTPSRLPRRSTSTSSSMLRWCDPAN